MNCNRLLTKLSVTALTVMALSSSALAATGTVTADGTLRLRQESNTTSAILANLPNGSVVDVSAVSEDGWYKVSYQGKEGYVSGEFLSVSPEESNNLPVIMDPIFGFVAEGPLNVRSGPSIGTSAVNILGQGTVIEIINTLEGWYQTSEGYLAAQYIDIITEEEAKALTQTTSTGGQAVVDYAMQFLGYRYVYGGSTPSGFDCSGFTSYVYKNFGISLNRSSRDQINNGTAVSRSELQPGDVLLFAKNGSTITHVGLYIGNNQMIHASTPSTGVIISSLDTAYYATGFVAARRML